MEPMEWYRQIQFVAAVEMPPDLVEAFGTTVNGMWADPEDRSAAQIERTHREGGRVLFSVPMIALTPAVYQAPDTAGLLGEVCRDIDGGLAECGWYFWESEPVYAACIYGDGFRAFLLERCRGGVDADMDVVNLDEIMTSVGLMNRDPRAPGFCERCLARFRPHLPDDLAAADDAEIREAIRRDDDLYERYRRFHEHEAFGVMNAFIEELRAYAVPRNPDFAISGNLAYLGNNVGIFGRLWGCVWGRSVDFALMENDYRIERGGPHVLLPRGTFAPWYRLAAALTGSPAWICPSINVPRQLAGSDRSRYHELMFLEAYANGGRWGYFWGPGDPDARLASVPDALKGWTRFIREHRDLYERATSMNDVAIVYPDGPMLRRPESHERYLALIQALMGSGYQVDVLHVGDGTFTPDEIPPDLLRPYRTLLLPEARDLGAGPAAALEAFARAGGEVIAYSEGPLDPALVRREDGEPLDRFWRGYRDEDRAAIAAAVAGNRSSRIVTSDPAVTPIRYAVDGRQVVHLIDYAYDEEHDRVAPASGLRVRIPWQGSSVPACTLLRPGEERAIPAIAEGDELILEIEELDPYALVVVAEA